jgi:uncharacterized membrane protein
MVWILLTFAAVLLWTLINISDKFVIDKWVKEPLIPMIIYCLLGIFFTAIVAICHLLGPITNTNIILSLISGGFYFLMGYYYFKAVLIEEISRLVPLFYLSSLLIAIFAAIFLGEVLSITKYLGILLLILGATIISVKKLEAPKLDKGTFYMILSATFLASYMLINKFVLDHTGYWTVFSWNRIGSFIFVLPILVIYRKKIIHSAKGLKLPAYLMMCLNETVNIAGIILITIATSIGLVTVISGLSAIQPLFVFFFTIILSLAFPHIIKEEINKKIITQKSIAIIAVIIGAILLIC